MIEPILVGSGRIYSSVLNSACRIFVCHSVNINAPNSTGGPTVVMMFLIALPFKYDQSFPYCAFFFAFLFAGVIALSITPIR